LAVNGVCASCSTSFTVTLIRYESSSRCPKCHSLVPFSLDWSLH
jgi:DNA-directed RNA polymerase subunit RPC12/RpoP